MITQRLFSVIMLIVGVILLLIGMNSSHSAADQISNAFTNRFTDATTWYILGGGVLCLIGITTLLVNIRSKRA